MLEETHPSTEAIQADVFRRKTPQERFQLLTEMSDMVVSLSRRALRRANPDATDNELLVTFIDLHYGRDLAERVRKRLAR